MNITSALDTPAPGTACVRLSHRMQRVHEATIESISSRDVHADCCSFNIGTPRLTPRAGLIKESYIREHITRLVPHQQACIGVYRAECEVGRAHARPSVSHQKFAAMQISGFNSCGLFLQMARPL